jgi:hypothetical protein
MHLEKKRGPGARTNTTGRSKQNAAGQAKGRTRPRGSANAARKARAARGNPD